jgi:hypothetical protein
MLFRYVGVALLVLCGGQAWALDVALVMSVRGKVTRLVEPVPSPIEAFVKLRRDDRVDLSRESRLQVVYFESGRQETWSGPGRLELTASEGKSSGLATPEVKALPLVMARQLARTPSLDSQGRGGVTRLRALPSQDALTRLDDTYRSLRSGAAQEDLAPEAYLLSGLFEMRELDRVERVLGDLQQDRPNSPEAAQLVALYRKALRNARDDKQ